MILKEEILKAHTAHLFPCFSDFSWAGTVALREVNEGGFALSPSPGTGFRNTVRGTDSCWRIVLPKRP